MLYSTNRHPLTDYELQELVEKMPRELQPNFHRVLTELRELRESRAEKFLLSDLEMDEGG